MKVSVLDSTEGAEKLMCVGARGDYMDDWNGEMDFSEIMSTVSHKDKHMDAAKENNYYPDISDSIEAKLAAFIEKQLGRGHFGPAEHPQITFTVKGVSRVTMAQITRHRHMSFDVQSQRYVDFSDTEAVVPATMLSDKRRHEEYPHIYNEDGDHFNRDEGHFDMDEESRAHWRNAYKTKTAEALDFYEDAVEAGFPKEDARFVLPVGTPVNMTFSGNARTFMHILNLRQKLNAQWEIRELSERIAQKLEEWMPYTGQWWQNHGPMRISP